MTNFFLIVILLCVVVYVGVSLCQRWFTSRKTLTAARMLLGEILQEILPYPGRTFHLRYNSRKSTVRIRGDVLKEIQSIDNDVWQKFYNLLVERQEKVGDIAVKATVPSVVELTVKDPV